MKRVGGDMDYEFADRVFLRAPLRGVQDLKPENLAAALADPYFRNAVWLASPLFFGELEKKGFDLARLDEKKVRTLLKYFNRICFRPTPFGAFAAFTVLPWADGSPCRLEADDRLLLHVLPGREYQVQLAPLLGGPSEKLVLNPLLYRFGKQYRYVYTGYEQGKAAFLLKALPAHRLIVGLLRRFGRGALAYDTVRDYLAAAAGSGLPEAEAYLRFLVEEQVLVGERQVQLADEHEVNVQLLERVGDSEKELWQTLRQSVFGAGFSVVDAAGRLEALVPAEAVPAGRAWFYAAAERPLRQGGLDRELQQQLAPAIDALMRLAPAPPGAALGRFVTDFKARYDRRKVPLLEALDPDHGIRYGDLTDDPARPALLEDIRFTEPPLPDNPAAWTAVQQLFLGAWLQNGYQDFYQPIGITEEMLRQLPEPERSGLPPSQTLVFRKGGDRLLIESLGGATALALLGRFSVFSEEVEGLCRQIVAAELAANPGVVFAELLQLSDVHTDNINRRRRLYPY